MEKTVCSESLIPLAEDGRDIVFVRMTAGNHIQTGTGTGVLHGSLLTTVGPLAEYKARNSG